MTGTLNRRDSLALLGGGALASDSRLTPAPSGPTCREISAAAGSAGVTGFTFAELACRTLPVQAGRFASAGYDTPGVGSGDYLRCTGSGPFLATRWRRQSRDGQSSRKTNATSISPIWARGEAERTIRRRCSLPLRG